jgi:hypothetical protein
MKNAWETREIKIKILAGKLQERTLLRKSRNGQKVMTMIVSETECVGVGRFTRVQNTMQGCLV